MSDDDRETQNPGRDELYKAARNMNASLQFDRSVFEVFRRFSTPSDEVIKMLAEQSNSLAGLREILKEPLFSQKVDLSWINKSIGSFSAETNLARTAFLHSQSMGMNGIAETLKEFHSQPISEFPLGFEMTAELKNLLKSSFVTQLTEAKLFDEGFRDAFYKVVELPEGDIVEAMPEQGIDEPVAQYTKKLKLDLNTFRLMMEFIGYLMVLQQFVVMVTASVGKITELLDDTDIVSSIAQAKQEARKAATSEWDMEALKHIRVTSGENVRLRVAPSPSAEIITELPQYKWLNVIDKTNRTWLEVNVKVGDEELTGWISRRYTRHLH